MPEAPIGRIDTGKGDTMQAAAFFSLWTWEEVTWNRAWTSGEGYAYQPWCDALALLAEVTL
jgi:hypothetical protein